MALLEKEMENVADDRAPTSPPGADASTQPMDTQPTLLERASLVAKRRAEGGASPPVCCMQQPAKQNNAKHTTLTMVYAMCVLLVTVRAVRYAAGGHVRTHHGSVTQEMTRNEQCMSHSTQKINITYTLIITGKHGACCAPSASSKLCTHTNHTQTGKGGGDPKAQHEQLTVSDTSSKQLLANTTYAYHLSQFAITTCSCSRVVTAAGGLLGGFWFGARRHPTHARARARARAHRTRTKPNRTEPHRTATLRNAPHRRVAQP